MADDGLKTDIRTTVLNPKDTKSRISKSELRGKKEMGSAGFEGYGSNATTITGSVTASIMNDGILGESQVITFVSGSNIRLDTNEAANIIRISVDDLNLWELLDVDDSVKDASDDDILQYDAISKKWNNVAVPLGSIGPSGPIGGLDKQILFNKNGSVTGSSNLTFDYDTNTVGITAYAHLNSGFSAGAACYFQDNEVNRAKLKDYAEVVYDDGDVSGGLYIINIENGNVQKFTSTYTAGAQVMSFLNPPVSGDAGSLTLIITNAATGGTGPTWPSSVKWASGNAPALSASGTDIVTFTTIDSGTIWYGFVGGIGFS